MWSCRRIFITGLNKYLGREPVAECEQSSNFIVQVVFETEMEGGLVGNVAIDDVEFLQFDCALSPVDADPSGTTTGAPTTTTTRAPIPDGPFNCDFDDDLCYYTQVLGACISTFFMFACYHITSGRCALFRMPGVSADLAFPRQLCAPG